MAGIERTRCAKVKRRKKLVRLDVVWRSSNERWGVDREGATHAWNFDTHREAFSYAREWAQREIREYGARGVSIRIHRKDGRMRKDGERTYPRSMDPRRSRG